MIINRFNRKKPTVHFQYGLRKAQLREKKGIIINKIKNKIIGEDMSAGKYRVCTLLMLGGLVLGGCGHPSSLSYMENKAGTSSAALDYETVHTAVFAPSCTSCHSSAGGNSGGVNLENYASVFSNAARVKAAVSDGSMPPSGQPSLSETQKNLVLDWIDSGSPQASSPGPTPSTPTPPAPTPTPTPAPTPAPSPGALTFQQVYTDVLQPKCISCHSGFSKYATVKADLSSIQSRINNGSMPQGSSLTSEQRSTILNWIKAGGPQ
jgi:hypothetical protein